MPYTVYILQTVNNTYYTGITTNLARRVKEHNGKGKRGAKYTKANPVKSILYTENLPNRSEALKREVEIKKLTKSQKLTLILKTNNQEKSLS